MPPEDMGSGGTLADQWSEALAEQTGQSAPLTPHMAEMMGAVPGRFDPTDVSDRILAQDEIDQVMGFSQPVFSTAVGGGVRAIAETAAVSHERLPMLEIVFDRMVRLLSSSLRAFFADNLEVTLAGITSVRFGDYLNSIPLPALLSVIRAEGWDNLGLVAIQPSLAYSTLDLLLGGRRFSKEGVPDGRAFTSIEIRLIRRLVDVLLTDAQSAFKPLTNVAFSLERIETNPRFAVITRPNNAAILAELRVDMEGRGGIIQMVLPYATIEPIRDLLLQSFMGEKLGRDAIWEGHFASELWQSQVQVQAVLHEKKLPLRKALSLAVGDTIMLGIRQDHPVTLRCGGLELAKGHAGRVKNKVAIKVSTPLKRSRTTLAAFEANAAARKDN